MRPRLHFRHEAIFRIAYGMRPVVYVLGFDNGMVKVGRTDAPRARLEQVSHEARRRFACRVRDVQVLATARNRQAEVEALRRMREIARPVSGSCEYFTGITFAAAVELVQQLTGKPSHIPAPTLHLSPPPGAVSRPPA